MLVQILLKIQYHRQQKITKMYEKIAEDLIQISSLKGSSYFAKIIGK